MPIMVAVGYVRLRGRGFVLSGLLLSGQGLQHWERKDHAGYVQKHAAVGPIHPSEYAFIRKLVGEATPETQRSYRSAERTNYTSNWLEIPRNSEATNSKTLFNFRFAEIGRGCGHEVDSKFLLGPWYSIHQVFHAQVKVVIRRVCLELFEPFHQRSIAIKVIRVSSEERGQIRLRTAVTFVHP
jgi:hypothetical protein